MTTKIRNGEIDLKDRMIGLVYCGSIERLRGQRALVREDRLVGSGNVLAQFDNQYHPEAFGWHAFPATDFRRSAHDTEDGR